MIFIWILWIRWKFCDDISTCFQRDEKCWFDKIFRILLREHCRNVMTQLCEYYSLNNDVRLYDFDCLVNSHLHIIFLRYQHKISVKNTLNVYGYYKDCVHHLIKIMFGWNWFHEPDSSRTISSTFNELIEICLFAIEPHIYWIKLICTV